MKISLSRLTEIVRGVVKEAAAQGKIQKIYKSSYNSMIKKASSGGNKNTPPFTKKAAKAGKSGLGPLLMDKGKWKKFLNESVKVYVHGYIKPESAFHTIAEWEAFANQILKLQKDGHSIRGGKIEGPEELVNLIYSFYDFQLNVEVDRYDLLTYKNVMDHIEDFVNHRVWGLRKEFGEYFPDINKLRLAYFYSRGDLEPYILIDDEFTEQIYGSTNNPKTLLHYTSENGVERIQRAIDKGEPFDISSYTVAERPFFRKESNLIMEFEGNVRAGFRSDVKSYSVDNGRKCVNLYRLGYPGEKENLCIDLENDCNGELKTSLWNEFIATPIKIMDITPA